MAQERTSEREEDTRGEKELPDIFGVTKLTVEFMDKYMLQKKEALIFTWGWGRSLNKQDSHPKFPFHQLLVFILYLMQTATNVSCSVFLLTEVTV